MEKIPSGCPSPARIQKTDSSSSRQSGSPPLWDIETCLISDHLNREARIRASSWDESDDESLSESERSFKPSHLYSNKCGQVRGSVADEINEIKKQFFETLGKVNQENVNWDLESLREQVEEKLSSDRRQSPARMRRRTKSSSSSSPVLESKSHDSPEKAEKPTQPEETTEEISSEILELDSKFYLNSFFTELRSKRISLIDSSPRITETGELSDIDAECIQICNEEKISNPNENDEYFCKTSRKLSQILEVEESKTDLEKSSEEKIENSELFFFTLKKPEENDFSPLQTARSIKSEDIAENIEKTRKQDRKFKSMSYEEFENFRKITQPFYGSLSERSTKIFDHKINDNIISLGSNTKKMQLNAFLSQVDMNPKNQLHLVSPASSVEGNKNLPLAPSSKDTEKSFDSREHLKIDLMKTFKSENSTPRKSTGRTTERNQGNKNLSAKSKGSFTFESPKFALNIGRDSARSLMVEDVNSPDSLGKNSDNRIPSEIKTPSFEYASPKKSNRSIGTPKYNLELKTDSNLRISAESLSHKSSKSAKSAKSSYRDSKELEASYLKSHRNSQKSYREKENQSVESERTEQNINLMGKTESYSSVESSRSYENPFNLSSRSESFTKISNSDEQESQKSITRPSSKSSRGTKSNKTITSNTLEGQISESETPRSHKIPELSLPLETSGGPESQKRSYWNETVDLNESAKDSDQSETNTQKNASLRTSERSLNSRNKNSGSKRSTPHSLKANSKPNSSSSSRSKDNFENHDGVENEESFRTADWKELEKAYDTVSNSTPISSAGRRNIGKESDMSSRQNSDRREVSEFILTSQNSDLSEERLTRSRKSSRGSVNSKVSERLENNSPSKSIKEKSRPSSETTKECKPANINADAEELDSDLVDIFTFEKDEKNHSAQKFESEVESGGNLNKKLSIINEVSFEDLDVSVRNEEKDVLKQSRPDSRRSSRQTSPQSNQALSKTMNENSSDESILQLSNPDDERWDELIETFCESSNTSSILNKTLFSFSHKNENSRNFVTNTTVEENILDSESHKNQDDFSILSKKFESMYEPSQKNTCLEKTVKGKDDNMENPYSVYEEHLLKKVLEEKDIDPLQNSQNLYYFNLDKEGPLEIGEFGDITCFNASQSDTADSERPRDHGDGIQIQKPTEILIPLEKREKEFKTQRQLWTKLKDFRDSKIILDSLFLEVEDDLNFKDYVPIGLKKSKSDNCVKIKASAEVDCESPTICEFLSECDPISKKMEKKLDEFENYSVGKNNKKSLSKSTIGQHSSLESLTCGRYSENEEFECEITPRLSRSLSTLNIQLEKENLTSGRSEEIFNFSRIRCFQKSSDNIAEEKDFTDLNIFLARNENEEKISVKSNNWLNFRNPETKKLGKRNQKLKKNGNNSAPSEDSFHEYLSSRKSRSNILHLKLRNSNCLQNFYKRLISVFCLTSHSSIATSK